MHKNILITGATGYLGLFIIEKLLENQFKIFAILRPQSLFKIEYLKKQFPNSLKLIFYNFEDANKTSLKLPQKMDTCIHLIGIIKEPKKGYFYKVHVEWTFFLLKSIHQKNVDFIFLSATGPIPFVLKNYYLSKLMAEELIKNYANISWCIIKSPLIYNKNSFKSYFSIKNLAWVHYIKFIFDLLYYIPFLGKYIYKYKPICIHRIYYIIECRLKNLKKRNVILNAKDLHLIN